MYVYGSGAWTRGYLDETPSARQVRISVHRQIALAPTPDQYFVRPPDLAMLLSYLRMLGPRRVVRKVLSRRDESGRNDAWVSVGLGRAWSEDHGEGEPVLFVVASGPQASERVVVARDLVSPVAAGTLDRTPAGHLRAAAGAPPWAGLGSPAARELEALAGWSPEAGTEVVLSEETRAELVGLLEDPAVRSYEVLDDPPPPSPCRERHEHTPSPPDQDRPRFHCFGYGQYAKTQVIPNLGARLELDCVHEINPVQIGPVADEPGPTWDTSAHPRSDEVIENAVVAGYHHTHAPTAVELLDRGVRHVVIEKPAATTHHQLEALVDAMSRHPEAKVHVAFQRRYSPFNRLLRSDLGDGPMSLAATVYEVPLPARHWYRWPASGNAVVSNGCHWIDHFLHLNGYPPVTRLEGSRLASQVVLGIELDNGASASISLRHEGAPRRGVRDLCVFFRGEASAVVEDQRRYRAEQGFRQKRLRTVHPYQSLEDMYQEIGRRIEGDLAGDSIESLRASTTATLDLAELVEAAP